MEQMSNNFVDVQIQTDQKHIDLQSEKENNPLIPHDNKKNENNFDISSEPSKTKAKNISLPSIHSQITTPAISPKNERSDRTRRLETENRKLMQQLKTLNDKLTLAISKQMGTHRRRKQELTGEEAQTLRQLQEAYKQIDTYKKIIQKQQAKQIPIEQISRINDLQNRIKICNIETKSLHKQIKTIDQIKDTQQKYIVKNQTEGYRVKMLYLTSQIQEQREKLKTIRKDTLKLQESSRAQHQCTVSLEALFKQLNHGNKRKESSEISTEATEEEWEHLKSTLTNHKQLNNDLIRRIDSLKKNKAKRVNQLIVMENKLKEDHKHLLQVQKKRDDHWLLAITTAKRNKKDTYEVGESGIKEQINNKQMNVKSISKDENKQNIKIVGTRIKNATKLYDCLLFPPQNKKIKIVKLSIWQSRDEVCGLKAIYQIDDKQISGNQIGNCRDKPCEEINLSNDQIKRISGCFNHKGLIVGLIITTVSGKEQEVGGEGISPFEIYKIGHCIECLEGAIIPNSSGATICELGCTFKPFQK